MSVLAILGAQWGDEGKGKIVDVLSEKSNLVARFQGGANAGHTIKIGNEETILHQLPSGILREKANCILGNGMVIDPIGLLEEIEIVKSKGLEIDSRIKISHLAHIVTPLHKALDCSREIELGKNAIGTTKKGIGPCYSDKISRKGIQARELADILSVKEKLTSLLNFHLAKGNILESEKPRLIKEFEEFYDASQKISGFVFDTISMIHQYIKSDRNILIEGAQGTLLDVDFGSYPFVTSSNTIAGNICTGLGISPKNVHDILGVFKAYTTRVGAGPFPTELLDATGDYLQKTGHEFGATTKRRRRCGWFDAVVGKYSSMINGFTNIALTKLDVLDGLDEIKICTNYKNGKYPGIDLHLAEPEYITLPGWKSTISGIRKFEDLPINTRVYINKLEELLETPIGFISVGKSRDQIISK